MPTPSTSESDFGSPREVEPITRFQASFPDQSLSHILPGTWSPKALGLPILLLDKTFKLLGLPSFSLAMTHLSGASLKVS